MTTGVAIGPGGCFVSETSTGGYLICVGFHLDTPGGRRVASLGCVLLAAVLVRIALSALIGHLSEAQAAVAGMTTAVLTAPAFSGWLGAGPLVPPEREVSYGVLCACSALAFLVFVLGSG